MNCAVVSKSQGSCGRPHTVDISYLALTAGPVAEVDAKIACHISRVMVHLRHCLLLPAGLDHSATLALHQVWLEKSVNVWTRHNLESVFDEVPLLDRGGWPHLDIRKVLGDAL